MYPNKLEIRVGRAELVIEAETATAYSERMGQIFSIRPSQQVLAYCLRNKLVTGFKF